MIDFKAKSLIASAKKIVDAQPPSVDYTELKKIVSGLADEQLSAEDALRKARALSTPVRTYADVKKAVEELGFGKGGRGGGSGGVGGGGGAGGWAGNTEIGGLNRFNPVFDTVGIGGQGRDVLGPTGKVTMYLTRNLGSEAHLGKTSDVAFYVPLSGTLSANSVLSVGILFSVSQGGAFNLTTLAGGQGAAAWVGQGNLTNIFGWLVSGIVSTGSSGTITNIVGSANSAAAVGSSTCTVTNFTATRSTVQLSAAGVTVTNAYGFQVVYTGASGTVTNVYGLHIPAALTGTNRWAILTAGADLCSFGGPVDVAATIALPAGGSSTVMMSLSSTLTMGVYAGSGAPTVSAAKGSLYLRSDGSGTTDRAYINTDGGTTWTAIVTVA